MRTVVIGHSFGGLIAFHGLSPAVLNELALTKPEAGSDGCKPTIYRPPAVALQRVLVADAQPSSVKGGRMVPVFPDMLVLINPAFEATRFEALHKLVSPRDGCLYPMHRPKVVVVTADNDLATGPIFTAGRKALTFLEAYPSEDESGQASKERDANTHAIGFTDRYKTHRLCLRPNGSGDLHAVAALTPPSKPDWTPLDPYSPVWVVGAPPEIINGHNGFLFAAPDPTKTKQEPYLLNWLVSLHTFGPGEASPAMIAANGCDP